MTDSAIGRAPIGRAAIRRAAWALLEGAFPGRCLLCGCWLLQHGAPGSPICTDCQASLRAIGPLRCQSCGMPLISERAVCMRCRSAAYAFRGNEALFRYAGAARELVQQLKFEGRTRVAAVFADLLAPRLAESAPGRCVVPVPPRVGRKTPDAVELISRALERRHGATVIRALQRTGGAQQKSLDLAERRRNLKGRIRLSVPGSVLPGSVVLLDDVFTTGATLDACAAALREAGCVEVLGFTLAIEE